MARPRKNPRWEVGNFVYFVQAESGGLIKIGYSRIPTNRLSSLMSWSPVPLVLLGKVSAPPIAEWQCHAEFEHLRERGEWFRPEPDLLAFIAAALASGKLPIDVIPATATRRPAHDVFAIAARHGLSRVATGEMMGLKPTSLDQFASGHYSASDRAYLAFLRAARERGAPITAADLYSGMSEAA